MRARLAKGESPESIIDDYVAEYGTAALSIPPDKGAMRAIYIAPLLAITAGGIALATVLRKWRANEAAREKDGGPAKAAEDGAAKRDDYDDRIDAELKDLDDA
jgi:cytochrome c-type biogenesis protein CcmH/NrfF